jgi:hypothetical protein
MIDPHPPAPPAHPQSGFRIGISVTCGIPLKLFVGGGDWGQMLLQGVLAIQEQVLGNLHTVARSGQQQFHHLLTFRPA